LLSVTTSRPSPFGECIFLLVQLLCRFDMRYSLASAPVDVKSRCKPATLGFQLKEWSFAKLFDLLICHS
jgi:hypothetical protein